MIQQLKRRSGTTEARLREERSRPQATLASVALHLMLGLVFLSAIRVPGVLDRIFSAAPPRRDAVEQIQYVGVAGNTPATAAAGSRPTAPALMPRTAPPPPLVAPREVPTTVPKAVATPPGVSPEVENGPLVGGRGQLRGAQPSFDDPRVWSPTPGLVTAPKSNDERLDSAVTASIKKFQDSVVANTHDPNKFERGDWTVEKDGKKYGIDQKYIHLGKFSIPTAVLALLPFNTQANPTVVDRQRTQLAMRADILEHAQIASNEDEFRRAVKAIRDRKEREHRNQPLAQGSIKKRDNAGPVIAPSERPPQ